MAMETEEHLKRSPTVAEIDALGAEAWAITLRCVAPVVSAAETVMDSIGARVRSSSLKVRSLVPLKNSASCGRVGDVTTHERCVVRLVRWLRSRSHRVVFIVIFFSLFREVTRTARPDDKGVCVLLFLECSRYGQYLIP